MAAAAWPSFISQLGLQGRRAIPDLPDRRDLLEFRDLPDHKELLDCRDPWDPKDLLGQRALLARPELLVLQDPLEQLDLPDLLALRALWDSQVRKVRKDRRAPKVHKALRALLAPPHLEPIQIPQWLVLAAGLALLGR